MTLVAYRRKRGRSKGRSTGLVPPGKERAPGKRRTPKRPPRRKPPIQEPDLKPPVEEPPPQERSPVQEPPDPEGSSVAGVPLSNPRKVLYPEQGLSKIDLARYVENVSDLMFPHVEGRPLMLLRCPEGRGRACFFQKHPSGALHHALAPVRIRESTGALATYITVREKSGLVALVQMGALELHIWGARADETEKPDRIVFDLDPDSAVPWPFVIETAHRVRGRLEEAGLVSYVKTTGGKGIHVVVPIRRGPGWEEIKRFSGAIASSFVREQPDRFTTNMSKSRRGGRIFIDALRNRRGATWVAPYSPRARPGAPVSAPVDWSELTVKLRPDRFTVETLPARLARGGKDTWKGMAQARQTVTAAMLRALRPAR